MSGDLQDVIPTGFEVGGVTGGGIIRKGKNSGKTEGAFHVLTMEVKVGHHAGGDVTVTAV